MSIKYIRGDATEPQASGKKMIVHICNDLGRWGKGFVLAISDRCPEVETQYRQWYRYGRETFALGNVQFINADQKKHIVVANMIAQHGINTGSKGPPIRYNALATCLGKVREHAILMNISSIHMPRIGCGLAGGTWNKIEPIILEHLQELDITVYDR